MEKENARKQTLEQLHERRKQVVRLHMKGIKIMQIISMSGLRYPAVRTTVDLYVEGGWSAKVLALPTSTLFASKMAAFGAPI